MSILSQPRFSTLNQQKVLSVCTGWNRHYGWIGLVGVHLWKFKTANNESRSNTLNEDCKFIAQSVWCTKEREQQRQKTKTSNLKYQSIQVTVNIGRRAVTGMGNKAVCHQDIVPGLINLRTPWLWNCVLGIPHLFLPHGVLRELFISHLND